ncbi:hypothetical protein TrispH2_007052 [Trichoplax sp. H2]|uniref:Expressed protein n=1 Tax=Trichoplax adhaerens TaxID=10228 RepID=B3S6X6_TRIAD|nr:expressed protein [Trichoplax adhaerens]EDV21469.1 expressed protein [Trichoplax adhaerens]RDD41379.1 hypothetical protein TrispH2_007052 [Trichoplax sp. H2]|eukprot:XP_002116069.1 expressed protein [Trichoplax adhaerens]
MSAVVAAYSTIAFTHMGIELIISGIVTIALHYGIGSNPILASVVYAGTQTVIYHYPVWGGVFAILVGIVGIIVGSAVQRTSNSVKGVTFVGLVGFITQFIAFCFGCNSISTSVTYLQTIGQLNPLYNFVPIIFSVIYMLIFLANFAVCIRFMTLGRAIIKGTATVIVQPAQTTVVIQQTTTTTVPQQPPGYDAANMGQPVQAAQPAMVTGVKA